MLLFTGRIQNAIRLRIASVKTSAIIFLIATYFSWIAVFSYSYLYESEVEFYYYLTSWVIGVVNYGLNLFIGDKLNLKELLFIGLIVSGSVWVFPPLLFTFFGIPFVIVYLAIVIYLHTSQLS